MKKLNINEYIQDERNEKFQAFLDNLIKIRLK